MLFRLRRSRGFCAILFIALCFAASAERRVAESLLDDVQTGSSLLSIDTVEGEEIVLRLVALAETGVPTFGAPGVLLTDSPPPFIPDSHGTLAVHGDSTRAPPSASR